MTAPENGRKPTQTKSPWAYASLGLEFATAVALFTLAGWWVDGHFGWTPWGTMVGALLGVAVSVYQLLRQTL